MGVNIQRKGEINLGGYRFPVIGQVMTNMEQRFPDKLITGDYSYSNEKYLSTWEMNDLSDGILVETMTNSTTKRAYWSMCDISYSGHITMPPLQNTATIPAPINTAVTLDNNDMEDWTGGVLDDWTSSGTVTEETSVVHGGSSSTELTYALGPDAYIVQDIYNAALKGTYVIVTAWLYQGLYDSKPKYLTIDDGVGTTQATSTTEDEWVKITCKRLIDPTAAKIEIKLDRGIDATGEVVYWDDVTIAASGPIIKFCEFNGSIYYASGGYLCKINSSAVHSITAAFPYTITDLCVSDDSTLLIAFNDTFYYSMDTSETFTERAASTGSFKYFVLMNSTTTGAITADGAFYYSATPASSSTWTANGSVTGITAGTVRGLMVAVDSNGTSCVYASCQAGLYRHSYADAAFYDTGIRYSNTSSSGLAMVYWQGYIYVSDGLNIFKYSPTSGSVTNVGLTRDDGIATWSTSTTDYIASFATGRYYLYVGMYSVTPVVSDVYAIIYKIDSSDRIFDHRPFYTKAANTVHAMLVSNVYALRLWIGETDEYSGVVRYVKYLAEYSNLLKPKKISGYEYDKTHDKYLHTPWFTGGSESETKIAKKIELFCLDTTSTERINVYYRLNRASATTIATGLTFLGTIAAAGANTTTTYDFASSVGVAFKSIQFVYIFQGGSTTTNSADLVSAKLFYWPDAQPRWSYSCQIDCRHQYANMSEREIIKALQTIGKNSAGTFYEFEIHDGINDSTELHYVKMISCQGQEDTGNVFNGIYNIVLFEP